MCRTSKQSCDNNDKVNFADTDLEGFETELWPWISEPLTPLREGFRGDGFP